MKTEILTLLTDLKAAARIGHEESLWAALDGLLDFPEVAGNPPMPDAFLHNVVLPAGKALIHPRLPSSAIQPLAEQPDAVLRGVAAAYFAFTFFEDGRLATGDLTRLAADGRRDVRLALQLALSQAGALQPGLLLEITRTWISTPSPSQQALALGLLPSLAQDFRQECLSMLAGLHFSPDPDWRAALADALGDLAGQGLAEGVLAQMDVWAADNENSRWVLCKALSRSWAAGQSLRALEILKKLAASGGPHKQITGACHALERHGAREQVRQAVSQWQKSGEDKLGAAAKQILGEN